MKKWLVGGRGDAFSSDRQRHVDASEESETLSTALKIMALEQRRRDAFVQDDKEALRLLLSDNLVFTHTNGYSEGKPTLINSLGVAINFLAIETIQEDALVRPEMGVVFAHLKVTVQIPGDTMVVHLQTRTLSVWAIDGPGWKLQAYQATRIT